MRDVVNVIKALADEGRLRILMALSHQELCVCQIVELLQLAPSTVSKHMSILKQARLVDSRKQGRWIYYRLADEEVPADARLATDLVRRLLSRDAQIRRDTRRLRQILKLDPEELCRRQHRCSTPVPARSHR
jgi:ArsR family transcriptional regulator